MGRIKSTIVKKATRQLVASESVFNDNFEYNKKLLGNLMPSKPIRNKIAGYITHVIRMEKMSRQKEPVK